MDDGTEESLAEAFDALGDVRRLRALRFIADRDPCGPGTEEEAVCACHVQEHLGLSQPATSYHMKVLRQAGLVTAEKRGRWVHYRVSEEEVVELAAFLDELSEAAPELSGAVA
jgi:ArsR family transcriptional regulator